MQLAGVIEALNGSTSAGDVFELVCEAAAPLGYRWVGLFALTSEAAAAAGASSPIVISNYPEGFAQSYLRLGRHAVDPVLAFAADTITALLWDDVVAGKSLSSVIDAFLDAPAEDVIAVGVSATGSAFVSSPSFDALLSAVCAGLELPAASEQARPPWPD